jgi:hypothetical protein
MKLTDADRAAVEAIVRVPTVRFGILEGLYAAGLRAGMERAAQVCEGPEWGKHYSGATSIGQVQAARESRIACAAAIREAAK